MKHVGIGFLIGYFFVVTIFGIGHVEIPLVLHVLGVIGAILARG